MSVSPPINQMMLMTDDEFADWYSKFREDVTAYIEKEYASWKVDDRAILRNQLYWDFWNQIAVDLDKLDWKWHEDAQKLRRSANDTMLSMRKVLDAMNRPPAAGRR